MRIRPCTRQSRQGATLSSSSPVRWAIAAVCEQIRDWTRLGIDPGQVAVNVSPRQFTKGDLQDDVLLALETYEVPPGCSSWS
jgi:EAL domain-containing protein (putative c-di-GMP-specific phosphodiesterase class I)